MGVGKPLGLVLALFALATFFYQSALVFYDALLANVSDEATRGRASALGVGLGYGGTIISLYSVAPIAEHYGKAAAFPGDGGALPRLRAAVSLHGARRRDGPALAPRPRRRDRHAGRARLSGGCGSIPGLGRFLVCALPLHRRRQHGDPLHGRVCHQGRRLHQRRRHAPARALDGLRDRRRLRRRARSSIASAPSARSTVRSACG